MEKSKKNKVICPNCKGNGYVRIPYELAREEVVLFSVELCESSEGEVNEDEIDNIVIDSDGDPQVALNIWILIPWTTIAKEVLLNGHVDQTIWNNRLKI